jgi:hypothetical protein
MRFTGHLDLHHTWERMLRRAGIAVEHTQGFNPRMRINLGLALPLGYTSECEPNEPTLQKQIRSATYEARLPESGAKSDLAERIEALLNSAELPRERRGKAYDLRPLIETLATIKGKVEDMSLVMRMAARPSATGRPDEVLLALGLDPLAARIHRKAIHFESE